MSHQRASFAGDLPTVTVIPPPSSPKDIPVTSYNKPDVGYGSYDSFYSGLAISPESQCGVTTPESLETPYGSYTDSGLFASSSFPDDYSNSPFLTEDMPNPAGLGDLNEVLFNLPQVSLSIDTCMDPPIIPMPTPQYHQHLGVHSPYSPASPVSSYGSLSPSLSSVGGLSPYNEYFAPLPPSPNSEHGSPRLHAGHTLGHNRTRSMRASPYPSTHAASLSADPFGVSPGDTLRRPRSASTSSVSASASASGASASMSRPAIAQVATESILRANESRRKHAATHRCEYPECAQTFTTAFSMRRHMVGHTEDRPFECGRCGQRFKNQSDCRRHERSSRKHGGSASSPVLGSPRE